MTMRPGHPSVDRLARLLYKLQAQVHTLSTQPQLGSSGFNGTIIEYDDDGNPISQIGEQDDGTHGIVVLDGPTPPTPTAPIVTSIVGGLRVVWDGQFVTGVAAPLDFARVSVYVSDEAGFTATSAELRSTVESPDGGAVLVIPLEVEPQYVKFICWSKAGKPSLPSEEVVGVPGYVPIPAKQEFVVADPPADTYQLAELPYRDVGHSSVQLAWVPVPQREGDAYTVNYTTGLITLDSTLADLLEPDDVLSVDYWSTVAAPDTGPISYGPYPDAVIADTPLFYYRMDGLTAAELDLSGHGRHGNLTGPYLRNRPSLLTTDSDPSTDLGNPSQGSSKSSSGFSYVTTPYDAALITNDFSYEFWSNKGSSSATAVLQWDGRLRIVIGNTIQVYFYTDATNATLVATSDTGVLNGSDYVNGDHHYAIDYDSVGQTITFFKDGLRFGEVVTGVTTALRAVTTPVYTGYHDGADGLCDTDEIAFYGHTLGANNVKEHYLLGGGVITPTKRQESPGTDTVSGASTVLTMPNTVRDGAPLVALVMMQYGGAVSTITGCGATWSRKVRVPGGSFSLSCEIWVGVGASGHGNQVTVTRDTTSGRMQAKVVEMTLDLAGTVRTTASAGPTNSSAPKIPDITPVVGEVVLGMVAKGGDPSVVFSGSPVDAPAAWTSFADMQGGPGSTNYQDRWGYRVATSTAAHSRTYTLTAATEPWVGASIVLA